MIATDPSRLETVSEPAVEVERPRPRPRPPLRVVSPAEIQLARRRARTRLAVLVGLFVFGLSVFGVVVAHIVLMQGQFELERLQRTSATQQAEYDRLRLQVAELESPTRIVATAQERLGMVTPPTITYLAPSQDAVVSSQPGLTKGVSGTTNEAASTATPSSWSTVKPHLSEG